MEKCWRNVGEMLEMCWRSVEEVLEICWRSVRGYQRPRMYKEEILNNYRETMGELSGDYRGISALQDV